MRRAELVNELFGLKVKGHSKRFVSKVKKAVKSPIHISEDLFEVFFKTGDPDKERAFFIRDLFGLKGDDEIFIITLNADHIIDTMLGAVEEWDNRLQYIADVVEKHNVAREKLGLTLSPPLIVVVYTNKTTINQWEQFFYGQVLNNKESFVLHGVIKMVNCSFGSQKYDKLCDKADMIIILDVDEPRDPDMWCLDDKLEKVIAFAPEEEHYVRYRAWRKAGATASVIDLPSAAKLAQVGLASFQAVVNQRLERGLDRGLRHQLGHTLDELPFETFNKLTKTLHEPEVVSRIGACARLRCVPQLKLLRRFNLALSVLFSDSNIELDDISSTLESVVVQEDWDTLLDKDASTLRRSLLTTLAPVWLDPGRGWKVCLTKPVDGILCYLCPQNLDYSRIRYVVRRGKFVPVVIPDWKDLVGCACEIINRNIAKSDKLFYLQPEKSTSCLSKIRLKCTNRSIFVFNRIDKFRDCTIISSDTDYVVWSCLDN